MLQCLNFDLFLEDYSSILLFSFCEFCKTNHRGCSFFVIIVGMLIAVVMCELCDILVFIAGVVDS